MMFVSSFVTALVFGVAWAAPVQEEQQFLGTKKSSFGGPPTAQQVRHELKKAEIIPTEIRTSQINITVIDDFHSSFLINATWGPHASAALGNTLPPGRLQHQPTISLVSPGDPDDGDDQDDEDMFYILDHKKHEKPKKHKKHKGDHHDKDKKRPPKATIPLNNIVIALTDPDAPSRDNPKWSEMAHWLAVGVSTNLSTISISDTLTVQFQDDDGDDKKQIVGLVDLLPYKPPGPPPKTGKHRYVFVALSPVNGTSEPLHFDIPKERRHWGGGEERVGLRQWAAAHGLVPVASNFVYAQNYKQ